MKKTNVLFSFFLKGKSLWVSLALIGAFFFLGMGSASAQLAPIAKNATPLEKLQWEYAWIQWKVDPLPPADPYHETFAPYKAWLEAMIHDMTVAGMTYHQASVKNRILVPHDPYPASTGNGSASALLPDSKQRNNSVKY